jgi:hypothetical protein
MVRFAAEAREFTLLLIFLLVQGFIKSHVRLVPEALFPELHLYVNLTSRLYLELIKEWVELYLPLPYAFLGSQGPF